MSSYSVGTYLLTLSHQQNTNSAIMSHSKPLQFLRFATVGYLVHNGVGTHQCASCMLQRLSHHPASHATTTLIAEARTHRQAASQDQHKHNADSTGPTVPIYRTACFIYCLTGTQLLLVALSMERFKSYTSLADSSEAHLPAVWKTRPAFHLYCCSHGPGPPVLKC
jgi:hypothetical protein